MKKEQRFERVDKQTISLTTEATVLVDRETGVHYLFVSSGYAGGLTPLLDASGRPVVSFDGLEPR